MKPYLIQNFKRERPTSKKIKWRLPEILATTNTRNSKRIMGPRSIISNDYKLVIDGDKRTGVELFNLKLTSQKEKSCSHSSRYC